MSSVAHFLAGSTWRGHARASSPSAGNLSRGARLPKRRRAPLPSERRIDVPLNGLLWTPFALISLTTSPLSSLQLVLMAGPAF